MTVTLIDHSGSDLDVVNGADDDLDATALRLRIRALRRARGWTQYDLAAAIGVLRPAVTRWERGGSVPVPAHLCRLATAFEVSLDVLMRGAP